MKVKAKAKKSSVSNKPKKKRSVKKSESLQDLFLGIIERGRKIEPEVQDEISKLLQGNNYCGNISHTHD